MKCVHVRTGHTRERYTIEDQINLSWDGHGAFNFRSTVARKCIYVGIKIYLSFLSFFMSLCCYWVFVMQSMRWKCLHLRIRFTEYLYKHRLQTGILIILRNCFNANCWSLEIRVINLRGQMEFYTCFEGEVDYPQKRESFSIK